MRSSLPLPDPELAETAATLAAWRSSRPRSARIPGDPWARATGLAGRHCVTKVAFALKLG